MAAVQCRARHWAHGAVSKRRRLRGRCATAAAVARPGPKSGRIGAQACGRVPKAPQSLTDSRCAAPGQVLTRRGAFVRAAASPRGALRAPLKSRRESSHRRGLERVGEGWTGLESSVQSRLILYLGGSGDAWRCPVRALDRAGVHHGCTCPSGRCVHRARRRIKVHGSGAGPCRRAGNVTAAPCACAWCPPGHANPPSV
jgi:hypothetical protein